jgi:hypothetical protein
MEVLRNFGGDISKFQFIQLERKKYGVTAPHAHLLPDLIQYIYDKKSDPRKVRTG